MTGCASVQAAALRAIAAAEAGCVRHIAPGGSGIVWRSWGEGPPLLLLHGHFGSWTHWIRNLPALAARFRLLLPDMPGFGDSGEAPPGAGLPELAASLHAGVDALLGPGARLAVGGFSLGSLVAAELASRLGARATACLLVSTGRSLGIPYTTMPPLISWRGLPEDERMAAHRRNLAALMLADPGRVDALAVQLQATNTVRARYRHAPDHHGDFLRRRLLSLRCPLIGIWGAADRMIGPWLEARREAFRAIQPDAQVAFIEGAGHWVQYEAAEAFDAAALAALAAAGAAPRVQAGGGTKG